MWLAIAHVGDVVPPHEAARMHDDADEAVEHTGHSWIGRISVVRGGGLSISVVCGGGLSISVVRGGGLSLSGGQLLGQERAHVENLGKEEGVKI